MQKNLMLSLIKSAVGDKSGSLDVVYKHVKNWHTIPIFILGLGNEIEIVTKDHRKFRIKVQKGFVEMQYKKGQVRFAYAKRGDIVHILLMLIGEFMAEPHRGLRVRGRPVVDVGAYIGDTAIYFALNGARHVYAIEPYPYSCAIAIKNIELNNLQKKITVINAGCASKPGTMKIDPKFENLAGADVRADKKGKSVKVITLEALAREYRLKDAALKIDCEGCEYDIIGGTSPSVLKKFTDMLIEYHYGYKPIVDRLMRIGFRTEHTKPEKSFNANTKRKEMYMGDIYATKK
ncbi:MAG: FkbM family methyltransferase [Candidatus Micrarchaeota archaeon]|nr:FkbM family methyltransferase [Candidatus Micrarchaeota archaeon]